MDTRDLVAAGVEAGIAEVALAVLAKRQTQSSRARGLYDLRIIARVLGGTESLPWGQRLDILRLRLTEKGYAPATVNRVLSLGRQLAKALYVRGLITDQSYRGVLEVKNLNGKRVQKEPAADSEVKKVLLAASEASQKKRGSPKQATRDLALLYLAFHLGLRRAEFIALDLEDLNGKSIVVKGKGNKQRRLPLTKETKDILGKWLAIRGDWPGPVFVAFERGDHLTQDRLSSQAIANIFSKWSKGSIKPHDARRYALTNFLDKTGDLSLATLLAGHSSTNTTRLYDLRQEKDLGKALEKVRLPRIRGL